MEYFITISLVVLQILYADSCFVQQTDFRLREMNKDIHTSMILIYVNSV